MATTVDELLKNPFSRRTLKEKVRIITMNKPRPISKFTWTSSAACKNKLTVQKQRDLDPDTYDRVEWLTRCDRTSNFFCWPCLLFMPPEKWNTGISDLNFALQNVKTHERSPEHIEAVFSLKIFAMQNNISKSSSVTDKIQLNETVRRSREILKLVIDAICAATKNRSRVDKYECNLLQAQDCLKILQFLKICHGPDIDLVDGAIELLNTSPKTLDDLVVSISMVIKASIVDEAKNSNYVSIIVNDHGTDSNKSQISTVLRYVKRDKVCERFIGFTNLVGSGWHHALLESHISNTVKDYQISGKVLALSIDGVVLPKSELEHLLQSIKSHHPDLFYFIPSSGFGYALLQSLSVLEECNLFLKTANAIEVFFEGDPRLVKSFQDFLFSRRPGLKTNQWCDTSPFVVLLSIYRKHFVEFFNSMVDQSETWSADHVVKAKAFRVYLQEMHTVFLLKTFHRVFSDHFDRNFKFNMESDGIFSFEWLAKFLNTLVRLRDVNGFADVWIDVAVDTIENEATKSEKLKILNDPIKNVYSTLFQRIMGHLIEQLEIRYVDLKRLAFCDMLHCNYSGLPNFKNSLVQKMHLEHGDIFDKTELYSEMIALKGNSSLFSNKSVYELLQTFVEYDFGDVFPQLYNLTTFILTLPLLPASEQLSVPKLKHIRDCSCISQAAGNASGEISLLCLEKEMVQDLKCSGKFYEDVFVKFVEVNKDITVQQM